ncbi:Cytochrome c oxidase subunit 2 precursor [Jannaschia seosinensis]|uniref:Cytochrome c oxidase subunit 2 n=1 Tax=Jannaschia seosinensis TaxID=313367 RepID=A0A0M7BE06_9RHOB|nr:cytochrome c [Jannaschia seosinensis]CUH40054.1 Cytochrome c oxidase subunit 2 precursor [Jannaschia seosinensis]
MGRSDGPRRRHTIYRSLSLVRDEVIAASAADIDLPPDWAPEATPENAVLFQNDCAQCHGAPGLPPAPFALGMMPVPTNLVAAARERPPEEVFWFIRDGLKMSGMPSWRYRMEEAEMWRITALVEALPALSPVAYQALLAEGAGAAPEPAPAPHVTDERAEADPAFDIPNPERGRRAMQHYACRSCHLIPGLVGRADVRVGPPLGEAGSRRYIAGVLSNTPENMVRWITEPQAVDPLSAMPDLGVSEFDARDMAAYLYTLSKSQPAEVPDIDHGGTASEGVAAH